jgi:hypothetical protein
LDIDFIVDRFTKYFRETVVASNPLQAIKLENEINHMRESYYDSPFRDECLFGVELISTVISRLKLAKAAGLDSLRAENLMYCHYIYSVNSFV